MNLNKVAELAIKLMNKHGLIERAWQFKFDNSRRRFGQCRYRTREIGLSKHLAELNDEHQIKDTILHEIAHALVGPGHGHDWVWRQKAIEIGCNGKRCYCSKEVLTPESKYIGICPVCKHTHKKHKLSKSLLIGIRQQSCGRCSNKFDIKYILEWKINPKY